jgi:hypothetical protein
MLCNNDKKQGHEKKAIELALTYVFISFGKVRLSAIVIHKHKTSLNLSMMPLIGMSIVGPLGVKGGYKWLGKLEVRIS